MDIILKDGKVWKQEYLGTQLVDITSEAEKYLFTSNVNVDEAKLSDFIRVLNSNPHLKAIFATRRKKEYENVVFKEKQVERALLSDSSLEKFLSFYGNKTDDEIQSIIENINSEKSPLDFFELEVTYEVDENGGSAGEFVDFVGVRGEKRYSMSLASIDEYFFTPIRIKHYQEAYENGEKFYTEINGSLKASRFFFEFSRNLDEMIFENERETLFDE